MDRTRTNQAKRARELDLEAQLLQQVQIAQAHEYGMQNYNEYRPNDTHPDREEAYERMMQYQTENPPPPAQRPWTPGFAANVRARDAAFYSSDTENLSSGCRETSRLKGHHGPDVEEFLRNVPNGTEFQYDPVFRTKWQELDGMRQNAEDVLDKYERLQATQESGFVIREVDEEQEDQWRAPADSMARQQQREAIAREQAAEGGMYSDGQGKDSFNDHDDDYTSTLSSDCQYHGLPHVRHLQDALYKESFNEDDYDNYDDASSLSSDPQYHGLVQIPDILNNFQSQPAEPAEPYYRTNDQIEAEVVDTTLEYMEQFPPLSDASEGYTLQHEHEQGMTFEDPWDTQGSEYSGPDN
jgi:hypothetical protein